MKYLSQVIAVATAICLSTASQAQDPAAERARVNENSVMILGGSITGTYVQIVSNMSTVLSDGKTLRVLPVIGGGSLKNFEDLLYYRGVDAAIMQSDVLDFVTNFNVLPNVSGQIKYIAPLYNEEVHIVARKDIEDISDLAGKKVGFGPSSSGTFLTASNVFDAADVEVEVVSGSYDVLLQDLKDGEIDAIVRVAGAPAAYLEKVQWDEGLHLIDVPEIPGSYVTAEIEHESYPGLIAQGEQVKTIAVPAVLAAYNFPAGHPRRANLEKLVLALRKNLPELQEDPFHPKWRSVDLDAEVPGWERFEPTVN